MTPPVNKTNKYTYYFKFAPDTSNESRIAIKEALQSLANRASKNKKIFENLKVNVCYEKKDLTGETPLSRGFKDDKFCDYAFGATVAPFTNDETKEIIIKTKDLSTGFLGFFCDEANNGTLKGTILHEFGHLFDFYFGEKDTELEQQYKNLGANVTTKNKKAEELWKKIEQIEGLSNSKEFKNAWREDVNKIGKTSKKEQEKLGYITPNLYSGINISDGVDDNELNLAVVDRSEAFAQLFSYALSPNDNIDCFNKESILKAYPKTMAVVKSFITKYFGISFN